MIFREMHFSLNFRYAFDALNARGSFDNRLDEAGWIDVRNETVINRSHVRVPLIDVNDR